MPDRKPSQIGPASTPKLRVLVAENHHDLSEVLARIIDEEPDMYCVGQVAQVTQVLEMAQASAADALILDLTLHGGSGMDLIGELAVACPSLRIVVFSGVAQTHELVLEAKRRGAAGYVTKGSDFQVLLTELRG